VIDITINSRMIFIVSSSVAHWVGECCGHWLKILIHCGLAMPSRAVWAECIQSIEPLEFAVRSGVLYFISDVACGIISV